MARTGAQNKIKQTQTPDRVDGPPAWRKALVPGLIGLAVVGGVAALVLLDPPLPGEEYPSQGNGHIESLTTPHAEYNSKPGSSGPHLGGLSEWGVHSDPVPNELFIHNLEDKGVVLAYRCPEGCEDLANGLEAIWEDVKGSVLVTPFEGEIAGRDGTVYRAAAVAWGRVYYFNELDGKSKGDVLAFIRAYEGIDHHPGTN